VEAVRRYFNWQLSFALPIRPFIVLTYLLKPITYTRGAVTIGIDKRHLSDKIKMVTGLQGIGPTDYSALSVNKTTNAL
jgi:hypothetical protein